MLLFNLGKLSSQRHTWGILEPKMIDHGISPNLYETQADGRSEKAGKI